MWALSVLGNSRTVVMLPLNEGGRVILSDLWTGGLS